MEEIGSMLNNDIEWKKITNEISGKMIDKIKDLEKRVEELESK